MSEYNKEDYDGIIECNNQQVGQINQSSKIGKYLIEYAKNPVFSTYLEIGTWNGLGSTKCIIQGLLEKQTPYVFYSLECNTHKSKMAQDIYKDYKNIFILNEVLFNDMPSNIEDIFPDLKDKNSQLYYFNTIDYNNMKNKPLFFNRKELPEIFDVVLLDGGEFTTYYEYEILKHKCKVLILDDTNCNKCKKIVNDIKSNPDTWSIIFEDNERNGVMILHNKILL